MSKPVAVLISDIHYDLATLELADTSLRMAIAKANDLDVRLIVAGDLHNTKANLRGECVMALRETFKLADKMPMVLVGNHDRINEKSIGHALSCLEDLVNIIGEPLTFNAQHPIGFRELTLVPYQHDPEALRIYLRTVPKGSTLIMHQGLTKTNSGHYIQDKSAITKADVAGFRVISGHYHTRQTIELPNGGVWDYIGNPYTLNYGEANDPPKGFQILMDDGSLEFVPTNLREHKVMELDFAELNTDRLFMGDDEDLLWVKIKGTREQLGTLTKKWIAYDLDIHQDFKLDLIPLESETSKPTSVSQTQPEILDGLIDSVTNTSDDQKMRVKALWKAM